MKKQFLLLVFALAATTLHAQREDDYLIWESRVGDYGEDGVYRIVPEDKFMQQRDGNFIIPTGYGITFHDAHLDPAFVGNVFYKVSPPPLTLVDSLFLATPYAEWIPCFYVDRDPQGEGNIQTTIKYDEEKDSTFLVISRFSDDSYYINHDEDILSPLGKGRYYDKRGCCLLDSRGDLIMEYWSSGFDSVYMARFGLDGTLKYRALIPSILHDVYNMEELRDSPLQYWHWRGYGNANLAVIVTDSIFQIKNTVVLNKTINEEFIPVDTLGHSVQTRQYFYFNYDTQVLPIGGDDILVAARYKHDTVLSPWAEAGVAVGKYDLRTMELKAVSIFNDYEGWTNEAYPRGLKQMSDGTVYFLYVERGYPAEGIAVVKMDADLNVEWKRWFKTDHIFIVGLRFPILYEDENGEEKGIAWVGVGERDDEHPVPGQVGKQVLVLFLLNHDGTVGVNEGYAGVDVRPYSIYPNPVQSQLNMRFSPDVQPAQVELYDLQGRLMRIQRNAFEHIDLSTLPAGTYLMRVTLKDGQVFSDKVVKE